jgi:hypothetical protein
MSMTARQVVVSELIQWLDRGDIGRFTEVQRLEEATGIWMYGKWCAKGAKHRLGVQPQIDYREAPDWETDSDRTDWDATPDISDDEGMRIHSATLTLDETQLEILERVYEKWEPPHVAVAQMKIGTTRFYRLRREALQTISDRLQIMLDAV